MATDHIAAVWAVHEALRRRGLLDMGPDHPTEANEMNEDAECRAITAEIVAEMVRHDLAIYKRRGTR